MEENFDGKTKTQVKIQNTGNIDAYIRARVVVTWKDASGNVYGKAPVKGEDYTISYNTSTWFDGPGGYKYYQNRVSPQGYTDVLISSCTALKKLVGYELSVEIIAEAIQADGKNAAGQYAVTEAWGVTVNDDRTISN